LAKTKAPLRALEAADQNLICCREAQKSLLPSVFPRIPNLEVAARFIPSALVSGDIYNLFRLDERRVGLYNIDISGHGISAALFSVRLNQRLSHLVSPDGLLKIPVEKPPYYQINPPDVVISLLDKEDLLGKYGHFLTLVYAVFDTHNGILKFCRAGHNFPLVIHENGKAEYMTGGGTPVGLHLGRERRKAHGIHLGKGDRFILFSDGLSEAVAPNSERRFGLDRVKSVLQQHKSDSLQNSFEYLIEEVRTFQGSPEFLDDVSIVGFEWLGPQD